MKKIRHFCEKSIERQSGVTEVHPFKEGEVLKFKVKGTSRGLVVALQLIQDEFAKVI